MTEHARVIAALERAGLTLPAAPAPAGMYVPAVRAGDFVFTSGQLPLVDGSLLATGIVGAGVEVDVAAVCARACVLNALAAASCVCDLDRVVRVVKLTGFVASAPDFALQPVVIDGASQTLAAAFGEAGVHAREAVGVAALPLGAPVEVSVILEMA